jgi:hypothetical protein
VLDLTGQFLECTAGCALLLCCAVLCCAVLCCAVLCCAVLCCAVLCCAVLCCAVLCWGDTSLWPVLADPRTKYMDDHDPEPLSVIEMEQRLKARAVREKKECVSRRRRLCSRVLRGCLCSGVSCCPHRALQGRRAMGEGGLQGLRLVHRYRGLHGGPWPQWLSTLLSR